MNSDIIILGMSEATISMLLDIMESNNHYPKITIVNNLRKIPEKEYLRNGFEFIEIFDLVESSGMFAIGTARGKNRKKVREVFNHISNEQFVKLISSKSDVSSTVKLGNGTVINPMSCVAAHTFIDDFSFINRGCSIGHHTVIEKYVTLNPAVNIAGNVRIGEGTTIGMGSNIIDGINIGSNSIIGAGSVVTKDIPDGVIAYGSPCKIIRENEA